MTFIFILSICLPVLSGTISERGLSVKVTGVSDWSGNSGTKHWYCSSINFFFSEALEDHSVSKLDVLKELSKSEQNTSWQEM